MFADDPVLRGTMVGTPGQVPSDSGDYLQGCLDATRDYREIEIEDNGELAQDYRRHRGRGSTEPRPWKTHRSQKRTLNRA